MYKFSTYFFNAWSLLINNPLLQIEAIAICLSIILALRSTLQFKDLKKKLLEVETTMATQKDILGASVASLEAADLALKEKSAKISGYVSTLVASVESLTQQVKDLEALAEVDLSSEIARIDAVAADIVAVSAELDIVPAPVE
jgi:hypothetical protein